MPKMQEGHTMNEDLIKYGSRKFIIACALIAAATWLTAVGKMESGHTMLVLGIAGGGYQLANIKDQSRDS
jgi:hypothetical protein